MARTLENFPAVLILAAGEARRMHGVKKQLLQIGPYTIIGRIISQVRRRGVEAFVISNDKEILGVSNTWYRPLKHAVTCETLLSTSPLWDARTIVLLGDVIYSNRAMDSIFACTDDVRVFGDSWEIFAISFVYKKRHAVTRALEKGRDYQNGKLRFFYRAYCGLLLDMEEKETVPPDNDIFYYIRDWTRDIDLESEYKNTILELVHTGVLKREQ